jgi:hypothetical protein
MQDMMDSLAEARALYSSKANSQARKWLVRLSSRVVYYADVMDMLVQHHPEYVSLGWGTFKLLFVVSRLTHTLH